MALEDLSKAYLDAQLRADRQQALRLVVDAGTRGEASVPDLLTEVVLPAQREIGRLWQENQISIADEHVATAISQVVVAQLYGLAPTPSPRGFRIMLACVEGEQHELGARIAADLLDLAGYDVYFAGANVPADVLPQLAAKYKPDLVALSITMSFHADALRRSVRALREQYDEEVPIAAGGHAFRWAPELASELELAATGVEARDFVANVETYFQR